VPGSTLAALNADVDEHEGLTQKARLHHPVGERGVGIGKQIQPLLRLTLRGAAPRLCSEQDSIRMIRKRRRVSVESEAAARALPIVHGTFLAVALVLAAFRPYWSVLIFAVAHFERGQRSGPCAVRRLSH